MFKISDEAGGTHCHSTSYKSEVDFLEKKKKGNESVLHIWVLQFSCSPVAYAGPVSGGTEYTEWIITTAEK